IGSPGTKRVPVHSVRRRLSACRVQHLLKQNLTPTPRDSRGKVAVLAALVVIATGCGGSAAHPDGGTVGIGGAAGGATGRGGGGGAAGRMGTGGGGGGVGGAAGGTSSTCAGLDLRQDGVLDLDLHAVSVTGTVTRNGAVIADQTANRGQILFRGI